MQNRISERKNKIGSCLFLSLQVFILLMIEAVTLRENATKYSYLELLYRLYLVLFCLVRQPYLKFAKR